VLPGSNGNVAQAPGVMASEQSVMSAFLAHAQDPYGGSPAPPAAGVTGIAATSPQSSATGAAPASVTVPTAPSNPAGNVKMGKTKAAARGWTGVEWDSLYQLWNKESSWRTDASNPTSSARGIAQTMMSVHFGKNWQKDPASIAFMHDPSKQIDWGMNYISQRYHKPSAAWAHSKAMNWYEKGAWETQDEVARLHRDEMVVPAPIARKMRQAVRDRGATVQSSAPVMSTMPGKVEVSIHMPVQLAGAATQEDARRLVTMMKSHLEQDETLALLGKGH
jgi:hypothetical protein